jgi:hypothetical protein
MLTIQNKEKSSFFAIIGTVMLTQLFIENVF